MKKVTSKELQVGMPTVLGAVLAAFVTNGLVPEITKPAVAGAPTQTEIFKKAGISAGIALLSGYVFLATDGKDAMSEAIKGFTLTTTGMNLLNTGAALMETQPKITDKLAADTTANRVIKNGLGLKCPETTNTFRTYPVLNGHQLRYPWTNPNPEQQNNGYINLG